jgi:hypothetical protein
VVWEDGEGDLASYPIVALGAMINRKIRVKSGEQNCPPHVLR